MTPDQAAELTDLVAAIRASVDDASSRFAVLAAGALALPEVEIDASAHDAALDEMIAAEDDHAASIDARAVASACTRCPLAVGRRRVVTAQGPHRARLVVIGPPVTFADERDNASMSGEPAVTFERMLSAVIGIAREHVVVVPAVMCRSSEGRAPTAAEAASCRPIVLEQVRAVSPELVLVFGEAAHAAMFGAEPPLKRVRGLWRELDGLTATSTWSPHECMRAPALKRETFEDLQKVRDALAGA